MTEGSPAQRRGRRNLSVNLAQFRAVLGGRVPRAEPGGGVRSLESRWQDAEIGKIALIALKAGRDWRPSAVEMPRTEAGICCDATNRTLGEPVRSISSMISR